MCCGGAREIKVKFLPSGINRVSQIKQRLSSVLMWVKPRRAEQSCLERGSEDPSNPSICVPCSSRSERDEENKRRIWTPNMSSSTA